MTEPFDIRAARPSDAAAWERMRQRLWPSEPGEHAREIEAYFAGERRGEPEGPGRPDRRGAPERHTGPERHTEPEGHTGRDPHSETEILLAVGADGRAIGFAEAGIRPYAEGCHSGRVAYLEGLYVEEAHRGRGVAAALVAAVEAWGRSLGCSELASDAELGNAASIAMHRALDFEEVERIVCFRKDL